MSDSSGAATAILLVEDEMLVRMMVVDHLDELGFRVLEAGSAMEAIQQLSAAEGRVGAAVIDVGLPDRKGDALAAEIRKTRHDLPIVIASGYGAQDLEASFGRDPHAAILTKPYEPDQLVAALRQLGVVGAAVS